MRLTERKHGVGAGLFLAIILMASPIRLFAQDATVLSLEGAIEMARKRSPAAAIARSGFEAARWDFRAFEASYLPSFSFFGTAPGFDRNITELQRDDGSVAYVPQSRTLSFGRLSIEQQIPLTGATISLQSGLSRIDQYGDNRFYQWRSTPLIAELSQPLFQLNEMRWERRLAPLQYEAATRVYEEELAQIAVDVTDAYFAAYIAQKRVEIARFNVAFNDTTYHISEGRFDLARITENELLESELQWLNAQSTLSDAQIEAERAMQALRVRLNLPHDAPFLLTPPEELPALEVDPAEAVALARDNQAEFLQQEVQQMQAERAVAVARHQSGLRADLIARYGLNQSADIFSDAYQNPLNQQSLQIAFRVPLFQWGRSRAQLESALATRDEIQETLALRRAELEQEVYFLALEVAHLREQVDLSARADTIAARRFEAARNLHAIGRIDLRDLFLAQQAKDSAQENYLRTLHEFWRGWFELKRRVGEE